MSLTGKSDFVKENTRVSTAFKEATLITFPSSVSIYICSKCHQKFTNWVIFLTGHDRSFLKNYDMTGRSGNRAISGKFHYKDWSHRNSTLIDLLTELAALNIIFCHFYCSVPLKCNQSDLMALFKSAPTRFKECCPFCP